MAKYKRYLVEQYLKENKIKKTKFCKDCGITIVTLNRFLKDDPSINMVTAISICNGIGMRFPDFVEPMKTPRKKKVSKKPVPEEPSPKFQL